MKIRIFCAVVVALVAGNVDAALLLKQRVLESPGPGLSAYEISAYSTSGEVINTFASISIAGTHNVEPAFGAAAVHAGQWGSVSNGAKDNAWGKYDTYFMYNTADTNQVVLYLGAAPTEINDGANPAGLSLVAGGQNAKVGLGTYTFPGTAQASVVPSLAGTDVPFLHVVLPTGAVSPLEMSVIDNTGAVAQFSVAGDNALMVGVPEPATIAMAGMGLIGMIGVARRRKA